MDGGHSRLVVDHGAFNLHQSDFFNHNCIFSKARSEICLDLADGSVFHSGIWISVLASSGTGFGEEQDVPGQGGGGPGLFYRARPGGVFKDTR